ncbi:MAG: hypothetical protein ACLGI5_13325 [Thermoleophilia bacterium]
MAPARRARRGRRRERCRAQHDRAAPVCAGRHHAGIEPDDLYGLPLDRFIAERTALARALRGDGRRDEAAAVAALRKPSVAAWAVNQLIRSQGSAVAELYAAGDALREAQAKLLAGSGDGRALRAANEREREAVEALVEAARGLLDSEGHELSATVVERVSGTLHAAALDEGARQQVRDGCLERELRHVGLGLGESVLAPASPPRKGSGTSKARPKGAPAKAGRRPAEQGQTKAQRAAREREARERAQAAERAVRERESARKAARSAETAARRRAQRSADALRAAEERRERAARALAEADEALASARAKARDAAAEHERARADVERL